jgi:hypothetical protein
MILRHDVPLIVLGEPQPWTDWNRPEQIVPD